TITRNVTTSTFRQNLNVEAHGDEGPFAYNGRKQRKNPTHSERVFEALKKKELEIRAKEKEN
ncbi:hypothetical protein AAVH_37364, partial [Aphelenchoides avenae]